MYPRLEKYKACKHIRVQSFTEYCLDCGENVYITEAQIIREEAAKELAKQPPACKHENIQKYTDICSGCNKNTWQIAREQLQDSSTINENNTETVTYAAYGLLTPKIVFMQDTLVHDCSHEISPNANFCAICGSAVNKKVKQMMTQKEIESITGLQFLQVNNNDDAGVLGIPLVKIRNAAIAKNDFFEVQNITEEMKNTVQEGLNRFNLPHINEDLRIYVYPRFKFNY